MSDSKRQREEEITPEPKKQRTSVVAEQALKCDSAPPLETRYGRVKDSRKIKVRTNLFETNIALDRKYYQFHVDFVPEAKRRKAFALIGTKEFRDRFQNLWVFDGESILFSQIMGGLKEDELFKFKSKLPRDKTTHEITITFTNTIEAGEVTPSFLQIQHKIYRQCRELMGHVPFNREYFNPKSAVKLPIGAELWIGYKGTFVIAETSPLLCVDVKQKVIRRERVSDIMKSLNYNKQKIESELIGAIVVTDYNKIKSRTYRITRIAWDESPKTKFKMADKKDRTKMIETSILDYYRDVYNIKIKDESQPLLVTRVRWKNEDRQEIKLVPELCITTGISSKELSKCRKNMILPPFKREEHIRNHVKELNSKPADKLLSDAGIVIKNEPKEVTGYVLDEQKINFKGTNIKAVGGDWKKHMRNAPLANPFNLRTWIILCHENDARIANEFNKMLLRVAKGMNVRVEDKKATITARGYEAKDFKEALDRIGLDRIKSYVVNEIINFQKRLEFIVVILPDKNARRYSELKELFTSTYPIPCTFAVASTIKDKGLSGMTNIFLQMQAKLKAQLWTVDLNFRCKTMVIGIDITHDPKRRGNSLASITASLDDRCSRYWSKAVKLEKGKELVDSLSQLILDAFKIYYSSNDKTLPKEIVVFRDGISEGELDAALAKEAQAIAVAARRVPPTIAKNYSPTACYILCNKRVNTKFFYENRGRIENVPIGALIDAEITRANVHEFYLISTKANSGTSNPVRYQVVHNRTGLSPVDIEELTYKLTHMYYNWSGTIRVPSPVFYAHKQAYFSSKVIGQKNVHDRLATSFYYL